MRIIKNWVTGVKLLVTEEIISFYIFFTIVFAECAYLWSHFEQSIAINFICILLAYIVNLLICGNFKGNWIAHPIDMYTIYIFFRG